LIAEKAVPEKYKSTIRRIGVFERPKMISALYFRKAKLLQVESNRLRNQVEPMSSADDYAVGGIFVRIMKQAG
jgi:hypothetical protein